MNDVPRAALVFRLIVSNPAAINPAAPAVRPNSYRNSFRIAACPRRSWPGRAARPAQVLAKTLDDYSLITIPF
jgi:hypothetical protein